MHQALNSCRLEGADCSFTGAHGPAGTSQTSSAPNQGLRSASLSASTRPHPLLGLLLPVSLLLCTLLAHMECLLRTDPQGARTPLKGQQQCCEEGPAQVVSAPDPDRHEQAATLNKQMDFLGLSLLSWQLADGLPRVYEC